MKRSYRWLVVAVLALGVTLTVVGRPRRHETAGPPATPAAPVVDLVVGIAEGQLTPALASVPKGCLVRLRVDYRGTSPARLTLAGYEDRVSIPSLAPGLVWTGEFLADRPGEDFAWLLDGKPVGRLAVRGSHLVDGHR